MDTKKNENEDDLFENENENEDDLFEKMCEIFKP